VHPAASRGSAYPVAMIGWSPARVRQQPAPDDGAPALALHQVTRAHGARTIWAPLDLSLAAGTLTVLTGPNGSGKTTLLRMAAGLLRPTTGVRSCPGRALYVRGGAGLRSAQTVQDAVATTAALAGGRERAGAAVDLLGLTSLAGRRVGTLSAGERVRAALSAAVATDPALLCLDEPTAVLDERGLGDLVRVLEVLRGRGTALLVASHQPEPLLDAADAQLVIRDGRVRAA
jgi:ABC-type multidrug transport system ATPase subunit